MILIEILVCKDCNEVFIIDTNISIGSQIDFEHVLKVDKSKDYIRCLTEEELIDAEIEYMEYNELEYGACGCC